jgi:hypothetical protein
MMSPPRKDVSEVFTPRNQSVNAEMYIERGAHEKNLYRSVKGSMHSFLSGESGSGKSWLYKKVFSEKNINFKAVNCANASRQNSITNEIFSKCFKPGTATKTAYKETKKAGAAFGLTAELAHEVEYEIQPTDKLLKSYECLYNSCKEQQTIIVLDNIETISKNQKLMDELSDILILLDDSDYAKYKVKFLLIGVPNEVLQYFSHTKNISSVGNRIDEIPRITGLDSNQILDFVTRGLVDYLKVSVPETGLKKISRHIYTITLGIPQRIHEYCEGLAYCIEDNNWNYNPSMLDEADTRWLQKGLRECYVVVQNHLNSDETIDGRRNQVIFALGRISTHQIDTHKIGVVIAQDFPNSAPDSNSGIGQVLASLTKGESPILKKTSNSSFYTFIDPRYLMCIRIILFKENETEKVKKKAFRIN